MDITRQFCFVTGVFPKSTKLITLRGSRFFIKYKGNKTKTWRTKKKKKHIKPLSIILNSIFIFIYIYVLVSMREIDFHSIYFIIFFLLFYRWTVQFKLNQRILKTAVVCIMLSHSLNLTIFFFHFFPLFLFRFFWFSILAINQKKKRKKTCFFFYLDKYLGNLIKLSSMLIESSLTNLISEATPKNLKIYFVFLLFLL